mgnify:CR=1 FL=1
MFNKNSLFLEDDIEVEAVLIDATECEIERPKKNKKNGIQEILYPPLIEY